MRRLLLLAVVVAVSAPILACADATPVTVTITQRTPMETLSTDGSVSGVSEATVGARLTLVSTGGGQIILQDAQGTRYRLALSSTDYQPPAAAPPLAAPAVATTTNAASPPAAFPTNSAVSPPKTTSTQNAIAPLPDSPVFTTIIGGRQKSGEMSVWPQGGIANRPLLIAAHGNGGSGPREIQGWLALARAHHFTIVCPTFLSSVHTKFLPDDEPYFNACLNWIKDNLQYNGNWVFMTGVSGGGFPTWYLATKHPDFFRGFFFSSANFAGKYYDLNLDSWQNRPIRLIWGSQDLPDIPIQNGNAVDTLKTAGCSNFTSDIIPGGHHQEHPDMTVSWMEQHLSDSDSN